MRKKNYIYQLAAVEATRELFINIQQTSDGMGVVRLVMALIRVSTFTRFQYSGRGGGVNTRTFLLNVKLSGSNFEPAFVRKSNTHTCTRRSISHPKRPGDGRGWVGRGSEWVAVRGGGLRNRGRRRRNGDGMYARRTQKRKRTPRPPDINFCATTGTARHRRRSRRPGCQEEWWRSILPSYK